MLSCTGHALDLDTSKLHPPMHKTLLNLGFAEFSKFGHNVKVMCLFVKTSYRAAILEENHRGSLFGAIPDTRQVGVILLFDGHERRSVLQQLFCSKNVILNLGFGIGIVKVNQDGFVLGKQGKDLIHGVVFGE